MPHPCSSKGCYVLNIEDMTRVVWLSRMGSCNHTRTSGKFPTWLHRYRTSKARWALLIHGGQHTAELRKKMPTLTLAMMGKLQSFTMVSCRIQMLFVSVSNVQASNSTRKPILKCFATTLRWPLKKVKSRLKPFRVFSQWQEERGEFVFCSKSTIICFALETDRRSS
ncbi:MAG: Uncharacterised protein [Candidatus Poseidoniaceae archaeon]|nr:MAG: Uncharacterised protein [Candidatus Poseidoniaceae archaeon]